MTFSYIFIAVHAYEELGNQQKVDDIHVHELYSTYKGLQPNDDDPGYVYMQGTIH